MKTRLLIVVAIAFILSAGADVTAAPKASTPKAGSTTTPSTSSSTTGSGFKSDKKIIPPKLGLKKKATQVSIGYGFACALLENGTVKCWGNNSHDQLGNSSTSAEESSTPVSVDDVDDVVAIDASNGDACVLTSSGTIKCWGHDSSSSYYGEYIEEATGINDAAGISFESVSETIAVVHENDTISLLSDYPYYDDEDDFSGIDNAVQISCGNTNFKESASGGNCCVVLDDGTIKCWGANGYGQLGNGTTRGSSAPVTVSGITNAVQVATSGSVSCAVLSDHSVKCWGNNDQGQLGDGSTVSYSSTPVATGVTTQAAQVSVGQNHVCSLQSTGWIKCWGSNFSGQLGDGSTTSSSTPVTVHYLTTAVGVSVDDYNTSFSCAVLSSGEVQCWGRIHMAS